MRSNASDALPIVADFSQNSAAMPASTEREIVPSLYTTWEVRACLPNGWALKTDDELLGQWDASGQTWSLRLFDGADMQWRLEVKRVDIEKYGRGEALRRSMNLLYRDALGGGLLG